MPNKMLIDATHPEETRVVVVRGNRVEEFDFESANRRQLRGNIYLAKVTRVEPSLQAAFIEYGGNRHGFLAFSEIHPDYYQIPVADRQALIEADERAHREAEEESENRAGRRRSRHRSSRRRSHGERVQSKVIDDNGITAASDDHHDADDAVHDEHGADIATHTHEGDQPVDAAAHTEFPTEAVIETEAMAAADSEIVTAEATAVADAVEQDAGDGEPAPAIATSAADETVSELDEQAAAGQDDHHDDDAESGHAGDDNGAAHDAVAADGGDDDGHDHDGDDHEDHDNGDDAEDDNGEDSEDDHVESVGGDDVLEEVPERAFRPRRQYKIQEVIKRRQVMLVQVVKEERGNKGAALTTYLSLAGRYAVLMPNTARGGGISRKITSSQDRSRLKDIVQDLDVPEGMGVILRTAGAARTKPEIKRDFEYLLRMWETVRDTTLNSQAPTLVYEEGSLIKRSLRDLYNKDIDDIFVSGEAGYREARDFMKMLMPSNVRAVKLYHDNQPLFSRMGVESQLDAMFSPTVQLRSGGYLVINQTEALVAIDVNSGRSTREHHIEDTALKTNLEAAEEVARQLRLRDLAGLIVIDFIDMDEKRNNRAVERKIADCLKQDRARIQIGRISHFGLLEMSRQRIRASMLESSTEPCPHCGGTGHLRSVSSVALQLLRGLEEVLMKGATHNLVVRTRTDVALYVLNHKRGHLHDLESAFKVAISIMADASVNGQQSFAIDRSEQVHTLEAAKALLTARAAASAAIPDEAADDYDAEEFEQEFDNGGDEAHEAHAASDDDASDTDGEGRRRRRRRRRRGGRGSEGRDEAHEASHDGASDGTSGEDAVAVADAEAVSSDDADEEGAEASRDAERDSDHEDNGERRPRRRGRRGGRRRRNEGEPGSIAAITDDLHPPSESESVSAAFDLDASSPAATDAVEPAGEPSEPPAPIAAPEPATPAAAQETATEESRPRRSTVREKVVFPSEPAETVTPQAAEATPAEAEPAAEASAQETPPAPAAEPQPEPAIETPATPRRAGWWSRRFGGA